MTEHRLTGIEACVFDAYGTLFDFNSSVMRCRDEIDSDAERLSDIWCQKQLQYTWLRSLMGTHTNFWQVHSTLPWPPQESRMRSCAGVSWPLP
jgi:2-haloacid dehalogenase